MKIAVIGTGISGLVAAYLLSRKHDVTVFEAEDWVGGHTRTVDVHLDSGDYCIDTGFIVFNPQNYPNFIRLLKALDVESQPSEMSFSVRCERTGLEYSGSSLNTLFAQRRNLLLPRAHRMLWDIFRFYREAKDILGREGEHRTLGQYLESERYSRQFIDYHILPMGAAIWSTGRRQIREIPVRYFVGFFHNHGFLKLAKRPVWRVIKGGSARYVEALTSSFRDRIRLKCPVSSVRRLRSGVEAAAENCGPERYDHVVIATHSDQALDLLVDPSEHERRILGAIRYQSNETVLHTDDRLLPRKPRAWASWNYLVRKEEPEKPCLTYYMNRLQGINSTDHFCVSLNSSDRIDPAKILAKFSYHHPVFTNEAVTAQRDWEQINGQHRTFFCGAYWGYGFHEDGVNSALRVCRRFGVEW